MNNKFLTLIICLTLTIFVKAQNEVKHERITVFKDGTSYIEKKLTASTNNKIIHFESLPVYLPESNKIRNGSYFNENERIILGTLLFSTNNNEILESIVTKNQKDSVIKQKEYESVEELLKLNIGKKVKIIPETGAKQIITTINNVTDNTLIGFSENSYNLFPIHKIVNLEFIDKPTTKKKVVEYTKNNSFSLDLKLQNESKKQEVNLSYIQRGITWLPTYFIDLEEQKKGKLILEANLLNDIEDFENTEINFAVGIPSFSFKTVNEPLVSDKNIWEILTQLNQQQLQTFSQGIEMNYMSQQRISYNTRSNEGIVDYEPEKEGAGAEDLYFYKKQNISLKKNGRLKTQLLSMDFDYEDLYSCTLEQNTQNNYSQQAKFNPVWHSIRLKNTSGQPFTTGTVFFKKLDKGKIALISQNQLEYTPVNEYATAKMSVVPDIMVSAKDVEKERKDVGNDYLLTIEAEISIANLKSFEVDIIVDRKIFGTMLDTDKPWKVTSNLEVYNAKNTSNQVSWKLKIPAGKTVNIKYKYKILVD